MSIENIKNCKYHHYFYQAFTIQVFQKENAKPPVDLNIADFETKTSENFSRSCIK